MGVHFGMNQSLYMVFNMPFSERLATIRKERHLTQEAQKGTSKPTLDVIKNLAIALSVTTDQLIFEEGERQPDDSLLLLLEGVSKLDPEEKHVIKQMVEGIMLKHQAKQLLNTQ